MTLCGGATRRGGSIANIFKLDLVLANISEFAFVRFSTPISPSKSQPYTLPASLKPNFRFEALSTKFAIVALTLPEIFNLIPFSTFHTFQSPTPYINPTAQIRNLIPYCSCLSFSVRVSKTTSLYSQT